MSGAFIDVRTLVRFDSKQIEAATDKRMARGLGRMGGLIRRTAKQSMRRRKAPSPAGSPPSAHDGGLKRIEYGYDRGTRTVVVGPVRYRQGTGAAAQEFGGKSTIAGRTVVFPPRPFMAPALAAMLPRLPGLLAGDK